jgi:glycosyltransferase involved in cell wall biosynthesis
MKDQVALMVCTKARGGMLSVVQGYERDDMYRSWKFQSLWTHKDGSALTRVGAALSAYGKMLGFLVRGKVSFMHVHAAMRGSFWRKALFVRTARSFGVPSIIHLHGSEMQTFYNSLSPARQKSVGLVLEKAEAVVVLSESWRKFVQEIAPRARITVLNNYVVLPSLDEKSPDTTAETKFNVLFLGLLGQRKGIYDLLQCWPAVTEVFPGARLRIGGNGEVELAKQRAAELGIEHSVEFLGWIDGERKLELLRDADVFVLPSYNEGLPMSVLEAMSFGKAVITTRVGGIPELVSDGDDGLLINAGNLAQLTTALLRLAQDVPFRNAIGAAARRRIEGQFSDKVILPRLEDLYRQVSERAQQG